MNTKLLAVILASLSCLSHFASAASITWTNLSGGIWSDATAWSPNQVPGPGDDALVTNSGTYAVSLDISVTVGSLTLGGSSGQQTIFSGASSLTLNGASLVKSNGAFELDGGVLGGGGPLTISGKLDWTIGRINGDSQLQVATNGLLFVNVANSGSYLEFSGIITNGGTIVLTNGGVRCIQYSSYGGGHGLLVNAAGGLIDLQNGSYIDYYNDNSGPFVPAVVNYGVVRKSGGNDTTSIYAPFYNMGTMDAQAGVISLNGGGNGSGVYQAEPGATVAYPNSYEVDGIIAGGGTNLLNGGILTFDGSLAGQFVWASGQIGPNSVGAVATNGLMVVNPGNGSYLEFLGVMTNRGTIVLTNGGIRCLQYAGEGGGHGLLVNALGGLIDLQSGALIATYNDNSGPFVPAVVNYGLVRKSSSTDTTLIYAPFYNLGTLDAQTGTISLNGAGGGGNGVFLAEAGATLSFANDYEVDGALTGAGMDTFVHGSIALNGVLNTASAVLTGDAVLTGTNAVIASRLDWTAGRVGADCILTVAANASVVVNPSSGGYLEFVGVMTNHGTIVLTNGGVRCIQYSSYGGGHGLLVNAADGLIDLQTGSLVAFFNDNSDPVTPSVVNYGVVRKSGGNDTTSIYAPFYNMGTMDAQAGVISLNGGGNGSGVYQAEPGATVAYPNSYEVDGIIAGGGTNLLNGGILTFDGSLAGQFVWASGQIGPNSVGAVATNGLMVVNPGNGSYLEFLGVMTNRGTIVLTNGGIRCLQYAGEGGGHGLLVNALGGLIDLQSGALIATYNDNSGPFVPAVVNYGLVRKSSSTDTTLIYAPFYNLGTLDAEAGTISLNGSYDLTGGRLNFGLNNLTNFGKMTLAGSAALTGTVSASLNNGYYPIAGDSFDVLSYGAQTGNFTNYVLPPKQAWSTNYGATVFNLTVLNSAPILPVQTNRAINELTLLVVTNMAIDLDIPADSLAYTLLAAPTNASISAAGVLTWTPNEAQGPSTNTFTTKVADNGTPNLSDTNTFTVIVHEVNTAPVLPTQTNLVVNELTTLVVTNTAVDSDIPINPLTYALLVAPTNAIISTNGVITWTPTEAQGPGTNVFITVVTDTNVYAINARSLSATNTFTVVVNEVNVAPVLTLPANTNINELVAYTATATATDADLPANPLTFALVSGPSGLTVSTNGVINWTPTEAQGPSTNVVTISVTDTNPPAVNAKSLSVTNSYQIVVNEVNSAPVLPAQNRMVINELTTLLVTNTATDSDVPTNLLTYSLLVAPGAAMISTNGIITWVTTEADGPSTNTFTTKVIDNGSPNLSATNTFTVVVNEVNIAPVLGALSNFTVNPGQTISFTATATDADLPANTLTFSLVSPPAGAGISSAGAFNWRATTALANTTNTLQVQVADDNPWAINSQHLSDSKSFTVIVRPLAPVTLIALGYTNSQFKLQVGGTTGPDYIISTSTNLTVWSDLLTNFSPATPFQYGDTNAGLSGHRFYRARLSP